MPNTFFIGDTHFGHANILKFLPDERPFKTIEEHDEAIVQRWNSVVSPDDRVFHLGDVYFGSVPPTFLDRLHGSKTLVAGNHDTPKKLQFLSSFFSIVGIFEWKEHILTHMPVYKEMDEYSTARFRSNIHGHLHDNRVMLSKELQLEDDWYWNVSAEQNNLTPIAYEELCKKYA